MTDVNLGKWPRIVVTGAPVTQEQADDIIVRTTALFPLFSNDKAWLRQVQTMFGIDPGREFESGRAAARRLHTIDLHYLENHQITSTWWGGPHGWVDWDGTVGCATWNVGKWPSADELTEDWSAIAAAFPYLDLEAWAFDPEPEVEPLACHWRVHAGAATELPPAFPPIETDEAAENTRFEQTFAAAPRCGACGRCSYDSPCERGVAVERLQAAIDRVRG